MSVIGLSMPLSSQQGINGTAPNLLAKALANPLEFGEPSFGPTMALDAGVRTVQPGPPSPLPRSQGYTDLHGIAMPSTLPSSNLVSPSSTIRLSLNTPITTPTRKGKEPASDPASTIPQNRILISATKRNGDGSPGKYLHPQILDLSWPKSLEKVKRPGAGLINPSMACYANSTLQVVLHTPPVLSMILAHARDDQETCAQAKKGFCALCTLHDMAKRHWQQARYPPREMHSHLGHIKKGFSKNKQEDAHEFFRFLTDSLQATALVGEPESLPERLKHTTWVHRIWGGVVRSRVVCGQCKEPSDTFDHFLDLSLDVNRGAGPPKLQTMLQGFIREERLEGDNKYKCERCKRKANATKFFRIDRAPPILTFHLKRFNVSYGFRGQPHTNKYNSFIAFPEFLDMSPYMVKGQPKDNTYRLFAVTCHRGSELRFGHYTSYVKGPHGKWYHADDEDMTPTSIGTVLQDRNAYLLSYIKIDPDIASAQRAPSESPSKKMNGYATPTGAIGANGTYRNGDSHAPNGIPSDRKALVDVGAPGSLKRSRSPDVNGYTPRPAKRTSPIRSEAPPKYRIPIPPLPPSDDPPPEPSDPPEDDLKEEPEQYGVSKFTWQPKKQKEQRATSGWNAAGLLGLDKRGGRGYGRGSKERKRGAPAPFAAQHMRPRSKL